MQVRPKSRHENLEMIQIYDTVTTEPNGRTIAKDMDNGPPCAEIYRKHSLPANLGEHQHSVANATQDCSISNGPKIGPNEMTDEPIYSQPDMNKKREESRKRESKRNNKKAWQLCTMYHLIPVHPFHVVSQVSGQLEREQKNDSPSIKTDDSGAVVQVGDQNNNPDDKVLVMGKDECLYDASTCLGLIPKRSKGITEGKKKEDGEEEL